MKKVLKNIIKMVSSINIDMTKHYKLYRKANRIVCFSYTKRNYKRVDDNFKFEDRSVPVSFFVPNSDYQNKLIIYFHGGGWVIGDVDTYTSTCSKLAVEVNCIVATVNYRLAPEYPFPSGLIDCYDVTKEIFLNDTFGIDNDDIILMGDSAGANIAAVVSIMASERKEFLPQKQILLYPVTYYDHSKKSPYASVLENDQKWGLTVKRVEEYMQLYAPKKKDRKTKYVSPMLATNLCCQPKTLIITAEYDLLRDEGEAYGNKLQQFGVEVEMHRILDCIHGFFSLGLFPKQKNESLVYIKKFVNGSENHESKK